jgi:hypothetical protein
MEYYAVDPIPRRADDYAHWLYRIHNRVNGKLRDQKLLETKDPQWKDVKATYASMIAKPCTQRRMIGWDFLFSIADLHPYSRSARKSIPMPGAPPCHTITTLEEKNKWNCLTPEERLPVYNAFWKIIGLVLPFKEWRESWAKHPVPTNLHSRELNIKWLWKVRCTMESDLELLNSCKYSMLCKTLQNHRSDCSKRVRGKTCRKRRLD